MAKYRKKPVVIDAIQWTGDNIEDVFTFMGDTEPLYMGEFPDADDIIGIDTLEGLMVAKKGDWIIKEPHPTKDRTFYPCKPDIFEQTYELVEDSDD